MEGIVLVDKEKGITTFDIVRRIKSSSALKKNIRKIKIGHGGALDPFATGLVVILFGSYTKLTNFLHSLTKTYWVTIQIGVVTDSFDITGKIINKDNNVNIKSETVIKVLDEFVGEIVQQPPALSSVKIKGKPAYWYFHRNQTVDLKPRSTLVKSIEFVEQISEDKFLFRIECGKGFYVRSFANDLGVKLGYSGGIACELVRTGIGPFNLQQAVSSAELDNDIIPNRILELAPSFKSITLSKSEILRLHSGDVKFRKQLFKLLPDGEQQLLLLKEDGEEIGMIFLDNSPQLALFF